MLQRSCVIGWGGPTARCESARREGDHGSFCTSSWALTIFLIGYAFANIRGGVLTRRLDPKTVVIWTSAIWSVATVVAGMSTSVTTLLACPLVLDVAEGVYWPHTNQQKS